MLYDVWIILYFGKTFRASFFFILSCRQIITQRLNMLQACILHNCMLRMNLFKYLVNQYGSKSSFAALFHIKLPQFLSKSNNRIPFSTAYKSLAKILNVDLSSIIYRVLQMLLPILGSIVNSSSRGSPWLVNRNLINWIKPYRKSILSSDL